MRRVLLFFGYLSTTAATSTMTTTTNNNNNTLHCSERYEGRDFGPVSELGLIAEHANQSCRGMGPEHRDDPCAPFSSPDLFTKWGLGQFRVEGLVRGLLLRDNTQRCCVRWWCRCVKLGLLVGYHGDLKVNLNHNIRII